MLSTFGAPCPDCQWAQPPFATVAKRYSHMNDTMIFGMLNTAKVRQALRCRLRLGYVATLNSRLDKFAQEMSASAVILSAGSRISTISCPFIC